MKFCAIDLIIRNFLSFGNNETYINLQEIGTTSIEGKNLDRGGSNGAGKTTIFNAICYALYNKPFDAISLQKLINSTNSLKNTLMEVRFRFTKGEDEYEIHRTRGESYSIAIYKNGVDIAPGKGVTECDQLIESIVGISYDLFVKTIVFSGNSLSFLQLPAAQQRNLIEELFSISLLSKKAIELKEVIRTTEADSKVQEAVIKQQELAVELHKKHITEAEERVERWTRDRDREIKNIEASLAMISEVDFEGEQKLHDEKAALNVEGANLAAKIAPLRSSVKALEKEVQKLMGEQDHLENAKCPYCSQNYEDAKSKLDAVLSAIEQKGEELIKQSTQLEELSVIESQIKHQLQDVCDQIKHTNLKELLKTKQDKVSLEQKLQDLKVAVNPHVEALERLKNESAQVVEYHKLDALKKLVEHQQFLLKLLTSKDSFLRRHIINKNIPRLNERINTYTTSLGLPHIVKFNPDLSCTVSEFGRELDFGNLSAGEKKRVSIGLSLAFRDVLHQTHRAFNLLLIDELDGQLDDDGIDGIIKTLKTKSRDEGISTYVISHHPAIRGRFDRVMVVQKEHGFSSIIEPV